MDRSNVPLQVGGVYVQIREAHKRDGWDIGGPFVAARTLLARMLALLQLFALQRVIPALDDAL